MELSKIDKNFENATETIDGMRVYTLPCEPFDLYGVFFEKETERFVRMPSQIAESVSENVAALNAYTSGGRVRFSTDAAAISVTVTFNALNLMSHMPSSGSSAFVLLQEDGGVTSLMHNYMPNHYSNEKEKDSDNSFSITKTISHDGKMHHYILHFPNYNDVKSLQIGVSEGAKVAHGLPYKNTKPILYYGSSITQGGCPSRSDNDYMSYISKWSNTDYINLGFSGSALGELEIANYLATIDASVFVCDYDFNAPNAEHLKNTHLRLYELYRAAHPTTPIVLISKPDYDCDPADAEERFAVIRETYDIARKRGDGNVYLIPGKELYGEGDRENCTVDGTHPNDLGFYRMAKRIYQTVKALID